MPDGPAKPPKRGHIVQMDVDHFHRVVCGIEDETTPAIRRPELRASLIEEEARETVEAIRRGDLVEAIDGMCDLLCVVYGTASEFGIDLAPFWDEVHATNLAKAGGPVREDGKRLKPEGWQPPDIARVLREVQPSLPTIAHAFYFGCARGVAGFTQAGHGFYKPGMRSASRFAEQLNPWGMVDAALAPSDRYGRLTFGERGAEYPQGTAALHHKDGWTALAFWDRTGDSRPNSNSNFLFDAELSFDQAVAAAREHFPELFERFNFDLAPIR